MKLRELPNFAETVLDQAGGDVDEAMRLILKWLDEPGRIPDEVRHEAMLLGFDDEVQHRNRLRRLRPYGDEESRVDLRAETEPGHHKRMSPDDLQKAIASIYDYPLRGGLRIGDASKAQIKVERDDHAKSEAGHGRKKRWLGSILRALRDDDDIVREHISEKRLMQMRKRAEEATE